ncbi:hypothetical protein RRG08_057411 [Elysia crispata]|uniref:Uncharacterized protein n=1 Tax=Elysia crispata TaxID=231223 RepID=A0AAE1CQ58_9GAST|nr:hypothetical protein RRG08_057411 [Elysia crispata]
MDHACDSSSIFWRALWRPFPLLEIDVDPIWRFAFRNKHKKRQVSAHIKVNPRIKTDAAELCDEVSAASLKPDFKGWRGTEKKQHTRHNKADRLQLLRSFPYHLTNRLLESAGRRVPIGIVTGFRRGMSVTYSMTSSQKDAVSVSLMCLLDKVTFHSKKKILLQTQFMRGRWD